MQVGQRAATGAEALRWLRENVRVNEDGCRIWAGTFQRDGYPIVGWQYSKVSARRLLMQLLGHDIDRSKVVFNVCGDRRCMNPAHLRVGSKAEAVAVRVAEGAYLSGAQRSLRSAMGKARTARLPITERHKVIALRAEGWSLARIGRHYGVTGDAVGHAIKAWERALGPAAFWREAA